MPARTPSPAPATLAPSRASLWFDSMRAAALADTRKPFSNGQFEAAVDGVRGVIAAREHDVNAQK